MSNQSTKIQIRSQVACVPREQLNSEPTYNGLSKRIGLFSEPFLSLNKAQNDLNEEGKNGEGKASNLISEFAKVFYTNTMGQIIEQFGKELDVLLVIETCNMIGEEVIVDFDNIDLSSEMQFEYNGRLILENTVLHLKILNEVERIPLRIIPQKEFYPKPQRIGKYEQEILRSYFTDIDGDEIDTVGWDNVIYLNIESQNMQGKEVSIDLGNQGNCFKHINIQGNVLKTIIKADLHQIQLSIE